MSEIIKETLTDKADETYGTYTDPEMNVGEGGEQYDTCQSADILTKTAELPEVTDEPITIEEGNRFYGVDEDTLIFTDSAAVDPPTVVKWERLRLFMMLITVLFATVGVIVWGSIVTDKIASLNGPISGKLLGRFLGRDVTSVGGTVRPHLNKIPSKPVEEGDLPGAAEDETVPDVGEGGEHKAETLPVKRVDLSVDSNDVFGLINETPYTPDVISLYAEELKTLTSAEAEAIYGADAPRVLVLHTHGTECYQNGGDTYSSDEPFRTYDTSKNVVAVGRVFAERLREYGIGVIHIETMFDGENYNEAYVKSAEEVKRILEKYPSVEYVFDIHRDAMFTHEGVNLAPTSPLSLNGGDAAQIMLVVGTDYAGAPHGEWEDNLSFALKLQKSTLGVNAGLMRSINLRSASFNAQYAKGAVLVEIGAAGNTLDEAKRAGELFADGVADVICGDG